MEHEATNQLVSVEELIQLAIRVEGGAVQFYRQLAERVLDEEARAFFDSMLRVEKQHVLDIDEILAGSTPLEVVQIPRIRVSAEFIESAPNWVLGEQVEIREALRVAHEAEVRAASFYQMLAGYLTGEASEAFSQMSQAERAHAALISRFMSSLPDRADSAAG